MKPNQTLKRMKRSFLLLFIFLLLQIIPAQAAVTVVKTDVSSASDGCVLLGIEGKYVVQAQAALARINEIRLEACEEGVKNPNTGRAMRREDYVPLKWSFDMEYIARIRAAESAVTMNHTRASGKNCFAIHSPNQIGSRAEVLAWNHGETMTDAINQWYGEKKYYTGNNSSEETGHYAAMIDPSYNYVGLGTFCSESSFYYNCTAGQFSSLTGLSERVMNNPGHCIQTIEVADSYLEHKLAVSGFLSGTAGESGSLKVTTSAVVRNYWGNTIKTTGLYLLGPVSWTTTNAGIASVSGSGLGASVRAVHCGSTQITARDLISGSTGTVTFSVGHKETKDAAVAPTCVRTGLTEGSHCPVCGTVLKEQKTVNTIPHSWNKGTVTTEPTALEYGILTQECTHCHLIKDILLGKLKPTFKVNANPLILKKGQLTKKLLVYGLAKGDYITSWAVADPKIAAVNQKGWVKGLKKGNTIVAAALASGRRVYIKVKVQNGAVATTAIKGIPKKAVLIKGKKLRLTPVLLPVTSVENITFTSSNKKVAAVTSKGVIQALRAGKARITVRAGKKKVQITVTVPKTATKKITGVPAAAKLVKGKKYRLKPVLVPKNSDDTIKFRSSNSSVVSVDNKGYMRARKRGKAFIYVTAGKITVRCLVTVN